MSEQSENDTKIAKKKAQLLKVPFVDPLRAAIEPSALSLLAPEMAIRLSKAFGGSAESWLVQEAQCDLWQAMQRPAPKVVRARTAAL